MRLAHLFSSDQGIPGSLPYSFPLRARGWDIAYLAPEGPEVSRASACGYRYFPTRFTRRMDPLGDVSATAHLMRTLLREKFDIVHTHNLKAGLVGRVVARAAAVPIIVHTVHGATWSIDTPEPKRSVNALLERAASLAADLIFTQSEADRDAFLKMRVVPPQKMRIIGNGVDLRRFDPALYTAAGRAHLRASMGVAPEQVLAVFAGRMVREKGLEEVYDASELLRDSNVRIAIAGRDDAERGDAPSAESVARARRAGVIFLGERRDMPAIFHAADVVALASWREGMPRVLIEGAAMGKPLLATNVRGCREVVIDEVTGHLVDVRSPRAIAEGLRRLAESPLERQVMGEAARRDALDRFDLNAAVQRVTEAYDELIARKGLT